jgi:uncharacterized protein
MSDAFFGAYGDRLIAASGSEIRHLLAQVDTVVPPRTEGRRSVHTERYCIVHYLRTLESSGQLHYPLAITKGESPDFDVDMGYERFGLEVIQAGESDHQRAMTTLEKSPSGSVLEENSVRRPGESLGGRGFAGDEPERLWTQLMLTSIQKKTELLPTYRSFPSYQLLLYDNTGLAALTAWTVNELPSRLSGAIDAWRDTAPTPPRFFSRFSVLRDRVLMYDIGGSSSILPVPPSPSLPPLLPLTRLGVAEQDLRAFCRRHHIHKLGFFGSARGSRFGPNSDVDVLVEFEPTSRIGLIGLAAIENELTDLLGRKADLRTVADLSRYFREEVVREKSDLAYVAG